MLQQPRVPPTGQRQAVEVHNNGHFACIWRTTGHFDLNCISAFAHNAAHSQLLRRTLPCNPSAMLQQPRVPPTGQRQAIEVHIKWREVLDYKRELLRCLSIATGWGVDKLDADMQRPLYMRPQVCSFASCCGVYRGVVCADTLCLSIPLGGVDKFHADVQHPLCTQAQVQWQFVSKVICSRVCRSHGIWLKQPSVDVGAVCCAGCRLAIARTHLIGLLP
jgi:hypothetical protein